MVTNTAQLHLAKLKYSQINPTNRTSDNPDILAILHNLKDLQIQKKLLAEPIHLEAALDYAEIRCNMTAPEEQAKNSHFFYKRMVDDFNNLEDPITQEYAILRQQHPEKNAIFNAYMQYARAQMLKYLKPKCSERKPEAQRPKNVSKKRLRQSICFCKTKTICNLIY